MAGDYTVDREIFARENIRLKFLRCFIFVASAYRKCSLILIIRCWKILVFSRFTNENFPIYSSRFLPSQGGGRI